VKLKKKNLLKNEKKNKQNQLKSTCQTCDSGEPDRITPWKGNKKNYEVQLKKYSIKKGPKI
jgi:hypothetical protein